MRGVVLVFLISTGAFGQSTPTPAEPKPTPRASPRPTSPRDATVKELNLPDAWFADDTGWVDDGQSTKPAGKSLGDLAKNVHLKQPSSEPIIMVGRPQVPSSNAPMSSAAARAAQQLDERLSSLAAQIRSIEGGRSVDYYVECSAIPRELRKDTVQVTATERRSAAAAVGVATDGASTVAGAGAGVARERVVQTGITSEFQQTSAQEECVARKRAEELRADARVQPLLQEIRNAVQDAKRSSVPRGVAYAALARYKLTWVMQSGTSR